MNAMLLLKQRNDFLVERKKKRKEFMKSMKKIKDSKNGSN